MGSDSYEYSVSFGVWKKVLELDSGDGYITLQIHKKQMNCTLYRGEFYSMWIISQCRC